MEENQYNLKEVYSDTDYMVNGTSIVIKIGQLNQELDNLQIKYGSTSWAYVTAENPMSELFSDEENKVFTNDLRELLKLNDVIFYEGFGQGKGDWKPENSFLILRTNKKMAIDKYLIPLKQKAIVIGEIFSRAELLMVEDI